MRIIITENQYTRLFEQEEFDCAPTGDTKWNPVDYSFYDMLYNGNTLMYGDYDEDETHPIWVIQKKLGIHRDGHYGKDMLEALSKKVKIDVCNNPSRQITIGPDTLEKLGGWKEIPDKEMEDYILASTLVGENQTATNVELKAILSTIKNRAVKCKYTMKDSVLKKKQYSTWNYYNRLDTEEKKFEELNNRISNQKVKGFGKMLKIVKNFTDADWDKEINHYVNPEIVNLSSASTRTIAVSYNKNKKSSQRIGDHLFWWDKRHSC